MLQPPYLQKVLMKFLFPEIHLLLWFCVIVMMGERMCGSVIEYHTRVCTEVMTEDGIGRNLDDGTISRMSLTFTPSG
jgi:hypothetical protein